MSILLPPLPSLLTISYNLASSPTISESAHPTFPGDLNFSCGRPPVLFLLDLCNIWQFDDFLKLFVSLGFLHPIFFWFSSYSSYSSFSSFPLSCYLGVSCLPGYVPSILCINTLISRTLSCPESQYHHFCGDGSHILIFCSDLSPKPLHQFISSLPDSFTRSI